MFINQKRVGNINNYLGQFSDGDEIRIILNNPNQFLNKLKDIGFNKINIGEVVLPKSIGAVSNYNANGKYNLLRTLPKEAYYQDVDMNWLAFGKHPVSRTITYTRLRYQKKLISSPSEELAVILDKDNNEIISSSLLIYDNSNNEKIKHIVNLFLELFGECQVVDKNLISRVVTPIKKLNWNILPSGKMPWDILKAHLSTNTNINSLSNPNEIYKRINYINSFEPDFIVTGNGGFNDYIVLGFVSKNLYVLENNKPQNATYIFEDNWANITKLSKAQILEETLQKARLIHHINWKRNIKRYLE